MGEIAKDRKVLFPELSSISISKNGASKEDYVGVVNL
jgi:hypothetical protein